MVSAAARSKSRSAGILTIWPAGTACARRGAEIGVAHDAVAGREPGHARADALDHAGELAARRKRKRRLDLVLAGDDQRVEEIQARRRDLGDDLAGPATGSGISASTRSSGVPNRRQRMAFTGELWSMKGQLSLSCRGARRFGPVVAPYRPRRMHEYAALPAVAGKTLRRRSAASPLHCRIPQAIPCHWCRLSQEVAVVTEDGPMTGIRISRNALPFVLAACTGVGGLGAAAAGTGPKAPRSRRPRPPPPAAPSRPCSANMATGAPIPPRPSGAKVCFALAKPKTVEDRAARPKARSSLYLRLDAVRPRT